MNPAVIYVLTVLGACVIVLVALALIASVGAAMHRLRGLDFHGKNACGTNQTHSGVRGGVWGSVASCVAGRAREGEGEMIQTLCIAGGTLFGVIFSLVIIWMEKAARHD